MSNNFLGILALIGGLYVSAKWLEVGDPFVGVGLLTFFGAIIYTIFTKKKS